jgi:transposase
MHFRYVQLSKAEQETLTKLYRSSPSPVLRQRCHGLLLSHQGQTVPQIAEILQKRVNTIRRWFDLWEQGGLEALQHKEGQGRKAILDTISKERMEELIEGCERSAKMLQARLAEEEHLIVSEDTVRRFLKQTRL